MIVAYANYCSNASRATEYLNQREEKHDRIYYNEFRRQGGLIIEKAFLGLSDHIYHVDAGIIEAEAPTTLAEYAHK